jgi:hypothetical protein
MEELRPVNITMGTMVPEEEEVTEADWLRQRTAKTAIHQAAAATVL